MNHLDAFTALAVTPLQLPHFSARFDWSRQPTAMGLLSYDPHGPDQMEFDLAIRIRSYGERASLLRRWATGNMPPGLCVGWSPRVDGFGAVSHLKDLPFHGLRGGSRGQGLISLDETARHGLNFVGACEEAGVECDARSSADRLDDYYTSSHERAAAGIVLDTVATFRLALGVVLGELRGGAALKREVEARMAANLNRLIRQAIADVAVLSRPSYDRVSGVAALPS